MLTKTNNGTKRLNRWLKTEQLVDYQKCSVSEMFKLVIESFLPSLYQRYVELISAILMNTKNTKGNYQHT